MLVPNYIFNKLVYTDGEQKGEITEEWEVAFSQLFSELQTNFSNEGLVAPSQPSSGPNNFAIIQPVAVPGTFLFDQTNDAINVRLQDGLFHPLQIGGLAVLTVDGTAGDISATRIAQTVTLDLVNTAVTAGTYTYPSTVTVDGKGRITNIASGGIGPVLEVLGTANEITVNTVAGVATVALASNPIVPGTGAITVPEGTTAQRTTPTNGLRYNSSTNVYELYYPTIPAWETIDVSGGTVTGVFGTSGQIVVTPSSPNPTVSIDPTYVGQTSITTLGTVTTGTWHGSLIPMAFGGTNANITATVNNLVYSTASAMALLATANNGVLVTSNTGVPSISNTLPQAVQANITEVGTVTIGTWNGFRVDTDYGGTGLSIATITDGQLLIGGTSGNNFSLSTLTAGSGVSITNGTNSITINATGTGGGNGNKPYSRFQYNIEPKHHHYDGKHRTFNNRNAGRNNCYSRYKHNRLPSKSTNQQWRKHYLCS